MTFGLKFFLPSFMICCSSFILSNKFILMGDNISRYVCSKEPLNYCYFMIIIRFSIVIGIVFIRFVLAKKKKIVKKAKKISKRKPFTLSLTFTECKIKINYKYINTHTRICMYNKCIFSLRTLDNVLADQFFLGFVGRFPSPRCRRCYCFHFFICRFLFFF